MLEPQSRLPLQEALYPPYGYVLDHAIGTTFSLDLMTMLTLPLSFTFSSGAQEDGRFDSLLLLEGIRRFAGRISVFCQAGQIAVPTQDQLLYGYLESSVIEVLPRSRLGVFHPKVWALRYLPDEHANPDDPVRYRLLVLSRNLTFDRSWDTMLALDGVLTERKNAIGRLHPLGDFFAALPQLALRPVNETIAQKVDTIQYELRRTEFDLPSPFTEIDYFPLGLKRGKSWPFADWKSALLVVSPFLRQGFLDHIGQDCHNKTLISRLENLSEIDPAHLRTYKSIYVLSPNAEPEEETGEENIDINLEDEIGLSGLHAKLFIEEQGWHANLWTGSANATNAAFHHNVEFMVRLRGKRSQIGINKLLREDEGEQVGLLNLLEPYTPPLQLDAPDPLQQELEKKVFAAHRSIVDASIYARVEEEGVTYTIQLIAENPIVWETGQHVICWPITLPDNIAVPLSAGDDLLATFSSLSFESITAFFAFELSFTIRGHTLRRRFVQNLPLKNQPTDRQARLLRSLLKDKNRVLRFLLLLLAEESYFDGLELANRSQAHGMSEGSSSSYILPVNLFESLVRALAKSPAKLDQIQRLVSELEITDDIDLLPPDFMEIWPQIWEAGQRIPRNDTETANHKDHVEGDFANASG